MAQILDKVLGFVGWGADEEEEVFEVKEEETTAIKQEFRQPAFISHNIKKQSSQSNVVNMSQSSQFKLVVMQPAKFEDAQEICEHLKSKKPVVINLEDVGKEEAQRIIDFLSGAVFALDGNIQKVSNLIFLIAPHNVDLMGDFKEELKNKSVFSWAK